MSAHQTPSSKQVPQTIIPVRPAPGATMALEAGIPTGLLRRTLGGRLPSRRTLGGKLPSRRTLGGKVPSRRTLGGKVPSRRTLGGHFPSQRTLG